LNASFQALQRGGRLNTLLIQNRDLVALVALCAWRALARRYAGGGQPRSWYGLIDPTLLGANGRISRELSRGLPRAEGR